ncbi:MAG: hypothetical protein WC414_04315 [Patescibacteria group bacterium]
MQITKNEANLFLILINKEIIEIEKSEGVISSYFDTLVETRKKLEAFINNI